MNTPAAIVTNCASCGVILPGPYGAIGVSLSRRDNRTLLCSSCGLGEAITDMFGAARKHKLTKAQRSLLAELDAAGGKLAIRVHTYGQLRTVRALWRARKLHYSFSREICGLSRESVDAADAARVAYRNPKG